MISRMVGLRAVRHHPASAEGAVQEHPVPVRPLRDGQLRVDNAMVKALARAFRWRKMLDEGVHGMLEDLARAKGVHATYVSRVLRLTLLAPEIVEAILDGRQRAELRLDDLLGTFSLEWSRQSDRMRTR
jgi:hypothetical protein